MRPDDAAIYDDDMSLTDRYYDDGSAEMAFPREFDPVEWVKENEPYSFSNIRFAELYVEAILHSAVEELKPKPKSYKLIDIINPILDEIIGSAFQRGSRGHPADSCREYLQPLLPVQPMSKNNSNETFSGWPKISEFNIKLGLEKLEEYIEGWKRSDEWMCCVEFLGFESEENSNYFVYEVEFSIPTPTYPIPQATASVYFSLEVSKMVPHAYDRCIDVSYLFESSNVIHYPGKIDFQESWIRDIIQFKLKFFRTLTF